MKLHVRTWGHAGDPAVVLVHGVQASSRTWWRMSPALAEQGWHVLAVDLRGHGLSPRAPVPFGLDELAADLWETVDAVIDRDRAGRAPVLWGHSLGALTVLEAVRLRPGGASRLVLEEPPGDLTVDVRQVADGVRADVSAARRDLPAFLARQRAEQPG